MGIHTHNAFPKTRHEAKGKEIRKAFIEAVPGLAELLKAIKDASKRGFIRAIDGRKIEVDSPHKALNYCLQSSAGIIAKRWMVIANEVIHTHPYYEANQLAFVHDELQFETPPKYEHDIRYILETSAYSAGKYYKTRIPIAAESKSGRTWAEVH